jgi:hypothetical protein
MYFVFMMEKLLLKLSKLPLLTFSETLIEYPSEGNQAMTTTPQTLSKTSYDLLLSLAKNKAEVSDQKVAIVIWDIAEDGSCAFELVTCRAVGNRNEPDMTEVNKLLEMHDDSEILEMVSPV